MASEATPDTEAGTEAAPIQIEYYTDPLCSWSWAFEPQWRRLRYEFAERIAWRYHMGGMLANWESFNDPINSVSRPAQMGPIWFQARHLSGMPLDDGIWYSDPPTSSYPACIAYYAAAAQGPMAGERYLRRLREAVMTAQRNIARPEVLLALANELAAASATAASATAATLPAFDAERFATDLEAPETAEAFRADLMTARYHNIGRFPSLVLRRAEGRAILITGYRPYAILGAALKHLAPELTPLRQARDPHEYRAYWGGALDREVDEAFSTAPEMRGA